MTPVKLIGAWCSRYQKLPARDGDLCRSCSTFLRAFGRDPLEVLWTLDPNDKEET